jgi:uncharacterized protein YcbX
VRVAALYAYPVKSCGRLELADAALDRFGFENDRRFAFVAATGRALTQRDQPLLATVRPTLNDGALRLDLGGLAELALRERDFTEPLEVDVWSKKVAARAVPQRQVAPAAEYLGAPVRLVALDPVAHRSFTDAEPVLVATSAMLARLNGALSRPVGMERFRPNLVLEGDAEDWRELRAQDVTLERAKPCGRCEVTTIDQATGERRGEEPLRILNERFSGEFGIYCRVARTGRVRVGEALRPA